MKYVKNVERALIATGVALVISGGAASAVILTTSANAATAQPGNRVQLAAQIGSNPGTLLDNGPKRGADLLTAAATYIGIPAADLKTQLATGKSLTDIALANGKTRDGLVAALVAASQQAISTYVDQKGTANPGGPGLGGPGKRGPGGERGVAGDPEQTAATYLGVTLADLETKTEAGQSLAAIAAATPGKSRDGLIQALVADATTKIEAAKAAGTITAAQATQQETGLADRMTKLVDSLEPAGGAPHR